MTAKKQKPKQSPQSQKSNNWRFTFYITGYGQVKGGDPVTEEQRACFEKATEGRQLDILNFID